MPTSIRIPSPMISAALLLLFCSTLEGAEWGSRWRPIGLAEDDEGLGVVRRPSGGAAPRRSRTRPVVQGSPDERAVVALRRGLARAERHLSGVATCRELFESLGSHGTTEVTESFYHWAAMDEGTTTCRTRNAAAFTRVGGERTCLCPVFGELSSREAAVVLIHEALHHAGLTEYPSDPNGMTPREIDELIKNSCAL